MNTSICPICDIDIRPFYIHTHSIANYEIAYSMNETRVYRQRERMSIVVCKGYIYVDEERIEKFLLLK